ncbi:hypothetical protein pEaSNUABM5_00307 [Erwinia phage pEa_SNUABM_5]|uniref:Uncharacterized protein n=1 Tax=Erwinia phage pEa_SNUABM_5 TaxID=2797313 RepID=A0A7T8EQB1_9CAUD|nr:hypothetical protein MPK73_gp307 [Erwinia phage pEa_SNUABM_5]QQO90449.1 hypothetical protein pEaSNUABM5_00307 [Erwinia phage pEa_SNUABM_5]
MDWMALYLFTNVRAALNVGKKAGAPPEEIWKACYSSQMRARDSIDNPNNTQPVSEGTRALVSGLHQALFPMGDSMTFSQRLMMLELFIEEEISKCLGGKYLWPHMYTAEHLQALGFQETELPGFYRVPYYLIDNLSRNVMLFDAGGQVTTTIEAAEPKSGYVPDDSGMLPFGMWALGQMPDQHKENFFLENL